MDFFIFMVKHRQTIRHQTLLESELVHSYTDFTNYKLSLSLSLSHFVPLVCTPFLHPSHLALALNMMGCVQSVGSFGVIWPTGAVGSRCGDKGAGEQGWSRWEKSRLSVGPWVEGPART